jgi:hypothetical protein
VWSSPNHQKPAKRNYADIHLYRYRVKRQVVTCQFWRHSLRKIWHRAAIPRRNWCNVGSFSIPLQFMQLLKLIGINQAQYLFEIAFFQFWYLAVFLFHPQIWLQMFASKSYCQKLNFVTYKPQK